MKTVAQTVIEADHFYTIAAHTGNVIQAVEGTKEAGTVRLGKYEHKPEQEWSFIRVGDGVYRIRNRASGKLLDLTMTGTANGTWLHLWEDVGGTSQMWTVQPTPEGTVRLRSSWAGGKCVDTVGMGAAVQIEVVGHLLAVEGHLELHPAAACCLCGKIGQQPSAHSLGRCAEDALRKAEVLAHGHRQQAAQQIVLQRWLDPHIGKGGSVQEQYFAMFGRNSIHHQGLAAKGVGLGKGLPGTYAAQDAFGAPEIQIFNVHGTTQHNADLPHAASGAEDDLVLCKLPGAQVPGSGKGIQLGF